jgi:DUF4097 and DUF4098 domain-containing protein YvlB
VDRGISIAADASIRISNSAGVTRIIGWDRDSIAVVGSLPKGAGFFFGGKGQFAKLGVERQDETVAGPGAVLEVRVPRNAKIWIRSVSATVEVSGLSGELECSSVAGGIRVDAGLKLLVAESMEGNLDVRGPNAVTRLKGGSGSVTLLGATGDLLVSSVGGPITITGGTVTRAHLETVSGAIAYQGSVGPRGTLEAVTHSGDVTLRLPADISGEFELESFDGIIDAGFLAKSAGPPRAKKGKPTTFVTREGGSNILVRTFKGSIRIQKP